MDEPLVKISEHRTHDGLIIGHAELNRPSALNSLNLEMIRLLDPCIRDWADRDDVVLVILTGSGDRAFCAGGDVQALYHAICRNHEANEIIDSYPFDFFAEEYRLDYLLHNFPKPLVTLGNGIVMGGGLGLFNASRYRILTHTSGLAFPEITIGLFPDAGATWMLRNLDTHVACFLGLTGSQLNATDAQRLGIGTHIIDDGVRSEWFDDFLNLRWTQTPEMNCEVL